MNIQNRIIEIVNSYSYDEDVLEFVKAYENNPYEEGEIIYLNGNIDNKFIGNTEEEIAKKVAKQIIQYRIREKAFIKLMSKGILHPVGIGTGMEDKRVEYQWGSYNMRHSCNTSVFFPRSIFVSFMKV